MKKTASLLLFMFALINFNGYSQPSNVNSNAPQAPRLMPFVENHGQILDNHNALHPEILYYTDVNGLRAYFAPNFISHVWQRRDTVTNQDTLYRMDAIFQGYNPGVQVQVTSEDSLPGRFNYLLNYLPNQVTGVKLWSKIKYHNLYPNSDLTLTNNGSTLNYFFDLAPTANLNDIRIKFLGASNVQVTQTGKLIITTPYGIIEYDKPKGHKIIGNASAPVNVNFQWDGNELTLHVTGNVGNNRITVNVERVIPVPPTLPIINQDIYWSTFFGFDSGTELHDNYIDASNNLYVAGGTGNSNTYPFTNSIMIPFAGDWDGIVAKFNSDRTLAFGTWIGGTGHDEAFSITSDAFGNTCFTGHTNIMGPQPFPICGAPFTCSNAVQTSIFSNGTAAFYVKLDLTGANVLISTFLGNSGVTEGSNAIAADGFGNVYVAGSSAWNDPSPIVSLAGAYNQSASSGGFQEAFLTKFDVNNNQVWGTWFSGNAGPTIITNLTVDASGNLFALGYTRSLGTTVSSPCTSNPGDFPLANPGGGAYVHQNFDNTGNTRDAFVAKFDINDALVWSTMYGGGGDESYSESHDGGIAVDDLSGAIYITSETLSNSSIGNIPIIPAVNPNTDVYWQGTAGGLGDVFIAKFNSSYDLVYSMYYGGDGDDLGSDITIGHSPILGPILGQTQIYFTGAIGFFTGYSTFPTQYAAEYYNQGAGANANAYIGMLKDDPSNSSNIPSLNWASCLTAQGAWSVSSYNNHVVVGGWCGSTVQPSPTAAPSSLSFYYPNPPAGSNGFITEFGILTCAICPPSARMSNVGIDSSDFSISPNPSSNGIFNVKNYFNGTHEVEIYNSLGQQVLKTEINESNAEIDLSDQPPGIYFLQIALGDKINTKKIVKQ